MQPIPSNPPGEMKWHVLQVKPRSEKKVGAQLEGLGRPKGNRPGLNLQVCVPIQKQRRTWSDRKKMVDVVLFKGYVFVSLPEQQRDRVFLVPNVIRFLTTPGRKVATLKKSEVALIKRLAGLSEPVEITYDGFGIGDEVEVLDGPFAGYCGRIIRLDGKARLQLEIPSLECFAQVEVEGAEVRRR
jgi:transcriptional antiterminator RfaH